MIDRVKIKQLAPGVKLPARATPGSAGYDIAACIEEDVVIAPGETQMIGAGFAIALPAGHVAYIYARSGLGITYGIVPANCVGVIDADYRGQVIVGLKNTSGRPFTVRNGDRIAQMVISRVESPELVLSDELDETPRGGGGFGSTGEGTK